MAVHAHPDDESSKGAATMARYVDEGVRVMVVTLTGGERGDILNPAMDIPDGFPLADLTAYDRKHNGANGEGNRDGSDNNLSWNFGVEGHSAANDDLEALRRRDTATVVDLTEGQFADGLTRLLGYLDQVGLWASRPRGVRRGS